MRIVDERLRLTTAAERVPHRAAGGEHRRGGVDGIATLREDLRAGGRGERLAGDREPMLRVEGRLLGLSGAWVRVADRASCSGGVALGECGRGGQYERGAVAGDHGQLLSETNGASRAQPERSRTRPPPPRSRRG